MSKDASIEQGSNLDFSYMYDIHEPSPLYSMMLAFEGCDLQKDTFHINEAA